MLTAVMEREPTAHYASRSGPYVDRDAPDPFEPTPERILDVARAHGTTVAAEWGRVSRKFVVRIRKEVDGYDRGRGRSSRAEMDAMAARWDCPCPRCRQLVSLAADDSRHRHAIHQTFLSRLAYAVGHGLDSWRARAACLDEPVEVFFPAVGHGQTAKSPVWARAKAVCDSCAVRAECRDFAVANRIPDGMFGGQTPPERSKLQGRSS